MKVKGYLSRCLIISGFSLVVADEESTIEEQEVLEGEADHKAELVDLAKDGTDSLSCICERLLKCCNGTLHNEILLYLSRS